MSTSPPGGTAAPQRYWIGDAAGRVLGPLTLEALRELVGSGRLKAVTRASRDGTTWEPLAQFAEVLDLTRATGAQGLAFEQQQAERLRHQLKTLQGMGFHDAVGAKPHASLDELRAAFFRTVKRFSPERLGPEVHPELRKANVEVFDFLSRRMREAEAEHLRRAAEPAPQGAAAARPAPSYRSDEFVGLQRRSDDRVHADIRVTLESVGMFTDHKVVNLSSGGLFVHSERPLRLGTELVLTLHFEAPARQLHGRGTVVWEHALEDGRSPRGYGLRLGGLSVQDREFLHAWVRRASEARGAP